MKKELKYQAISLNEGMNLKKEWLSLEKCKGMNKWKQRLEEYLRKKLITAGWKEDMKTFCKGKTFSNFRNYSGERYRKSNSTRSDEWIRN